MEVLFENATDDYQEHRFLRLSHRPRRIEHAQLDASFIWTLAIVLMGCICLVSCGVTIKIIAHRRSVKRKLREYGIIIGDSSMSIHPDVRDINRMKIEQGNKVLRDNYFNDNDRRPGRHHRRVSSARNRRRENNRSFEYGDNAIENLAIIDHTRLDGRRRPSSKYNKRENKPRETPRGSSRGSRRSNRPSNRPSSRPSNRHKLPPIHKRNNYFDAGQGF